MEAEFDGQDYLIVLNEKRRDLQTLREKNLEAKLVEMDCSDKKFILEFAENKGPDGIYLMYFPKECKTEDDIEETRVKINEVAYNHIFNWGRFRTRYGIFGVIEILHGWDKL